MAAEQLKNLIAHYLTAEADEAEDFCSQYMNNFEELCNELENEVDSKTYEIYDEIRWFCDAYENNEEIRKQDAYCIDADQLKQKLNALYQQL